MVQDDHAHHGGQGHEDARQPSPRRAGHRPRRPWRASATAPVAGPRRWGPTGQRWNRGTAADGPAVGMDGNLRAYPARLREGAARYEREAGGRRLAGGTRHRGQPGLPSRGATWDRRKSGTDGRRRSVGRPEDGLLDAAGGPAATGRAVLTRQQLLDGDRRRGGLLAVPSAAAAHGGASGDAGATRVPRRLVPHRSRHLLVVVLPRHRPVMRPAADDTGREAERPPDARHRRPRTGEEAAQLNRGPLCPDVACGR